MDLLTPPTLCRAVACIVGDGRLAATLSSVVSREGEYLAMVGEPRMGRPDRKAEVLRRCNAMFKVDPEVIALVGLSASAERAFQGKLEGYKVVVVKTVADIEAALQGLNVVNIAGEIRCRTDALACGLLLAKRSRKRLIVDDSAPALPVSNDPKSPHLVVVDDHDPVAQCIAANYAYSLGADLQMIPQRDDEVRERVYQEIDDRGSARLRGSFDRALNSLSRLRRELAPSLRFCDRTLLTFVTRGIPYGFFCPEVPSTHLFAYPHLGEMIIAGIYWATAQPYCLAAVVVDPGSFAESETPTVIAALRDGGVVVEELVGKRAVPELVRLFMQGYPYDFFFVCSHCGDSSGTRWCLNLPDGLGRSMRVEVDEVIHLTSLSFVPTLKDQLEVTQLMRPISIDGTPWFACPAEARSIVMEAWSRLRGLPRTEWPVIDSYKVRHVAHSPAIEVQRGAVLLTMIHLIDVGVSPTMFCNSCVSYYDAAQTLTYAGARAYIGTLAPVDTDLAKSVAESLFHTPALEVSLPVALWAAQQAVFSDPDDRTYVHAGCHFNSLRLPRSDASDEVRRRILAAQARWADKDPADKESAEYLSDQIRGFLAALLERPYR